MVDSKPHSVESTRIKFQSIFEAVDMTLRKTKIVATLGESCNTVDMIVKLLDAGMNVARLNFAEGDHKTHDQSIKNLKEALKQRPDITCGVMLDTKGPEIRSQRLSDAKPVQIEVGQSFEIVNDPQIDGNHERVATDYKNLPDSVSVGSIICMADGKITTTVTEVCENSVKVRCENDGVLQEMQQMYLPGSLIDLPTLEASDIDDIVDFGIKNSVDFVAVSLTRKQEDIEQVQQVLAQADKKGIKPQVIAKIQNSEGLNNFEEILALADGIMICRANLGMEIPPEKVFIAQKWMIEKANLSAKSVLCAQQMIESMCENPRPSRAEASDIANCILDGADALVLDRETSNGQFVTQSVQTLAKCCVEAERCIDYKRTLNDLKMYTPAPVGTAEAVAAAAVSTVQDMAIDLIIVLTDTGKLARLCSKYRPNVPILACAVSKPTVRSLNTVRGVIGYAIPPHQGTEGLLQMVVQTAKKLHLCKSGNKVVSIHGSGEETPEESNVMKIIDIE